MDSFQNKRLIGRTCPELGDVAAPSLAGVVGVRLAKVPAHA
jgi:hypothetical protein